MTEAIVEVWKELPDTMKWGLLPWLIFTAIIFYELKHKGRGRKRLLKIIKNQTLQNFYLNKLKQMLDYTAKHFFKDHKLIKSRRDSRSSSAYSSAGFFNTYSESSYTLLLRLALLYPLLFLIASWFVTSQGGEIGDFKVFADGVSFFKRLLIVGSIGFLF